MLLDFVVYVAMLAVFSFFVLFHSDGELTWGEVIFFASFVAVSFAEIRFASLAGILVEMSCSSKMGRPYYSIGELG